jgi:hypothetical protein
VAVVAAAIETDVSRSPFLGAWAPQFTLGRRGNPPAGCDAICIRSNGQARRSRAMALLNRHAVGFGKECRISLNRLQPAWAV